MRRRPGLLVAFLHVVLALGLFLAAELELRSLPKAWVRVVEFSPIKPARGERIWLSLEVFPADGRIPDPSADIPGKPLRASRLFVREGRLTAELSRGAPGLYAALHTSPAGRVSLMLPRAVQALVPAKIPDLPIGAGGAPEFQVEVAVPEWGPPRPLRMAMRGGGGVIVFPCE